MAYTTIKKPSDYFNTKIYTGNGGANSSQSITGVGFKSDLVWIKARTTTARHALQDIIRGTGDHKLSSNETQIEGFDENSWAGGYISSFDSDGFTANGGTSNASIVNNNGENYVAWNWLASNTSASNTDGSISSTVSANTTSGFSIVSYTGNETSGATVGHGLSTTPKMIIIKNRNSTDDWVVYHESLGNTQSIRLNLTNAAATTPASFNNTSPTSSVFTLGDWTAVNGSSMIAYCFAEKKGFSKFGSYIGNGNADGTFVYTGFKPAFLIVKGYAGSDDWIIMDNKRSGYNSENEYLDANNITIESDGSGNIDFLSNGFKIRSTFSSLNYVTGQYIYMAFAEEPLVGDNPATAR